MDLASWWIKRQRIEVRYEGDSLYFKNMDG